MQDKRFEILKGLPPYGPMYVPVSRDGIPFYSEGFVVQFYKRDGTSWTANFNRGWTNFSGVYDFPKLKRTVVFAFGQCYIMADEQQKPLKVFSVGITNVFQAPDNILIAVDHTDLSVIEVSNDTVWHSERISWDGFKDISFSGDYITGLAYEPGSDDGYWISFSFNYRTKELIGGTYRLPGTKKPWWKIW